MQVQVVENQAVIVGKVRETAEDPSRKGFFTLKVDVERVDDVAGMPNLMAWAKKMTIDVTIAEKDLSVRPLEPSLS